MSLQSKIEWTDATWNPVRGCTKVSPGCLHCYAETFAERFRGVPGHPFEFGFDLRLVPEKLGDPLRWSTSRMDFRQFHERPVPRKGAGRIHRFNVARVMKAANWHTYQILTKRAERMQKLLKGKLRFAAEQAHIWWGVSVENRKHGLPRDGFAPRLAGASPFPFHRTVAGTSRPHQFERHQLGDCRRRKRAGRATDGQRLGA